MASDRLVATAACDVGNLRFYQRLGFRMSDVVRDVFVPENGYPEEEFDGIPLRDQVRFDLTLPTDHRPSAGPAQKPSVER